MCGIWGHFVFNGRIFKGYQLNAGEASKKRGPDRTIEVKSKDYHMVFHRLAIHDLSIDGDQPFHFFYKKVADRYVLTKNDDYDIEMHLMCNGEIYNYKSLIKECNLKLQSSSDCEVLCHLLAHLNFDIFAMCQILVGEFSFIIRLYDKNTEKVKVIAARDHFGVRPLYYSTNEDGIMFSSMMKDININSKIYHFKPGNIVEISDNKQTNYVFKMSYPIVNHDVINQNKEYYYKSIVDNLTNAVHDRLDSDREVGFLLSGGLDSSLVVALAKKIKPQMKVKTFSIAFSENATDLEYAKMVAKHVDANHTIVMINPKEAIKRVEEVVKAIETYDTTTVRASIPQFLLAEYIANNTKIRVILNGDGSDEVSMGYLYNYYSPSNRDSDSDSKILLDEIHYFDGLRVDRTLGYHGLEARIPFLDPTYIYEYLSIPTKWRKPIRNEQMEKQMLRDAFKYYFPNLLPNEVLYRRKEAFSDAVSSVENSWFEMLNEAAKEKGYTNDKEWFKAIFDREFPNQEHIVPHYWMPKWTQATDPSARTLNIY